MGKPSVIVEGLGKKFGLSLKSALRYGMIDSARRVMGRGKDDTLRPGEFWALDDVSFELESGDAVGIMGVNGSGKTTMLRILNGSYTPDKGTVELRGRVGALIAAGAGFSPLLTGRENVYINGTLLGMTPAEITKKFDEIVQFADLEQFIDMPVRNYSSGMAVRLGFAVAAIGSPDILLVDEVLAVGDISFQKKCFDRIHMLRAGGTTILLVSHAPGAIWAVCNKGLVLDHGRSGGIVPVEAACRRYEDLNALARAASDTRNLSDDAQREAIATEYGAKRVGTGKVKVTGFRILDGVDGRPIKEIGFGKPFKLEIVIESQQEITDGIVRVGCDTEMYKGAAIIDSYEIGHETLVIPAGKSKAVFEIVNPVMRPGAWSFSCSVVQKSVGIHLFLDLNISNLVVLQPTDRFLHADYRAMMYIESRVHLMKEN
ncbi:MAG: ATP-binding cassette domain-containing protein [Methylobacteriaceae bacterium]|jgi:lipopolysaccharide transport system ATP-binding protein|nr:ATP-binding cassette domain-containing protein [Methylobacteriaceae bacterium]